MNAVLQVVLILYGVFLLFFVIHGAFLTYHLLKFSINRDTGRTLALAFVGLSTLLVVISLGVLTRVHWQAPLFPPSGINLSSPIR